MRILFSNGTQLPFERMTNIFLKMAAMLENAEIYYQAGKGAYDIEVSSSCRDRNKIHVFDFCPEDKYEALLKQSDIVVTHAGMGNVINLLAMQVDFVMFPRLVKYGEHRNNHQLDSAVAIFKKFDIPYFTEENELVEYISNSGNVRKLKNDFSDLIKSNRKLMGDGLNSLIYGESRY
ncbi:hypothetical protein GCM10010082_24770 [Kushneria pakistanensis]|uniref:Glycosyl transferase family 28 C-terminal domain-containing protein n=1 Tax=Kushneria pakistanensis TaxID=1508770 RepID=A0ABQ3FMY3_9GAMM|nr:glycosyltransferase [Kushneria pakistanensis]GHC29847.1 hypothetical protein GCM10010082_24770 [Kushneria pakistanensis]